MDEPLLPALPVLSQQNRIEELIAQCQKASFKTNEFLIIYQSVGVEGTILPDEDFAQQLQQILGEEKLLNGKRARVTIVNETNCEIEEVLKQMSASVIVLVVFSEAALQTFSADNHGFRQNNYLLFLQFALQLHHAKGVRMLGLNLVAVDDSEAGVNAFVKFQGWCVHFSDVPHYSEWIQDSISKSMKKIFAIQGITMDPEDWEFKVPTLFASLYAAQDEINASGWHLIKIIPWKSISGLMAVFAYSLIPFFFIFTLIYWKCSKKSKGHREAYFNVSLFAAGISHLVSGIFLLGVTIFSSVKGVLCSSALECEVMVRAGSRWALWREYSKECQRWGITCYAKENTDYMWNQDFNSECAQCVCSHLRTGDITDLRDEKSCTNEDEILFGSLSTIVFVVGLIIMFVALHRLQKQALVIKREIKIVSKPKNDKRSILQVDDSV